MVEGCLEKVFPEQYILFQGPVEVVKNGLLDVHPRLGVLTMERPMVTLTNYLLLVITPTISLLTCSRYNQLFLG